MDASNQLVQGHGRGNGRLGPTTSTAHLGHGRGRGSVRVDNASSEVLPVIGVGQESGQQEPSEARVRIGTTVSDISELPNSERNPGLNGGVSVERLGRARADHGRGHELEGSSSSSEGAVQGRGRGRGQGRGRGRARGQGQGRERGRARGRGRGRGRGRSNAMHEENDISMDEMSDSEESLSNPEELPDAPMVHPINEVPFWQPPRPRQFTMQELHRSESVLNANITRELVVRHHKITLDWDDRYKPYLLAAGLYGVHQIGYILADSNLITALVERWRPETHTFHLPVGEMAVTLEDAAMLFGLQIDGDPIYEPVSHTDWPALIKTYLGVDVDDDTFRTRSKTAIKISWLYKHFKECPIEEEERYRVPYFARAYMLMLVGSVLFTDLSGDCVSVKYLPFIVNLGRRTYSWGSAVLAFLHKELCRGCQLENKQVGGPVLLLQLWAWTRFLFGRPEPRDGAQRPVLGGDEENERPPYGYIWSGLHRWTDNPARSLSYYRDEIDLMREYQVNWMPYTDSHHLLPPKCLELPHMWLINAPLVCLRNVESYNPHRVMRQFGRYQLVPPRRYTAGIPFTCSEAEKMNRPSLHGNRASYVALWNRRLDFQIMEPRLYDGTPAYYDNYMKWYAQNTILQLQPPKAMGPSNIDPLQLLFQAKTPNNLQACKELQEIAEGALKRRQETMEVDTKEFALDVLVRLERVLKMLGHNVESDETFVQLHEQLQVEEEQWQEGQGSAGEATPDENAGNPSQAEMSTDSGSTSDEPQSSGSKRLRGG